MRESERKGENERERGDRENYSERVREREGENERVIE